MTRGLYGVPIVQMAIEHYIFDLGYPAETVAKIVGVSVEYVRSVEELALRYRV